MATPSHSGAAVSSPALGTLPNPEIVYTTGESDRSSAGPAWLAFAFAGLWLVLAAALGLVSSIKSHGPGVFESVSWLTYGRVRPAFEHAIIYGFAITGGLGVAAWLLPRLGRTLFTGRITFLIGLMVWNFGVLAGLVGILAGDNTGYRFFEMPRYGYFIQLTSYLLLAICLLLTVHARRVRTFHPAHWFLLLALFWFAWIFSTAGVLLQLHPLRGVLQAVVQYWYAGNLFFLVLTPLALAALVYFHPGQVRTEAEGLSRYQVGFVFWVLLLCGHGAGFPPDGPFPAWIGALSTVFKWFVGLASIAAFYAFWIARPGTKRANAAGKLFRLSIFSFLVWGVAGGLFAIRGLHDRADFSLLNTGWFYLALFGFVGGAITGAILSIIGDRQNTSDIKKDPFSLASTFYTGAAALTIAGAVIGGLVQMNRFGNQLGTLEAMRGSIMFIGLSTLGLLLLLFASLGVLRAFIAGMARVATEMIPVAAAKTRKVEVRK
jgi:cytochrome c oxidase cbb3-type subunit 1